MENSYDIGFDILTNAIRDLGEEGVAKQDVLPTLLDFTATVAVALGGEEAVKACIIRLLDLLTDLNADTFPVDRSSMN